MHHHPLPQLPQTPDAERGKCATCGFLAARFLSTAPATYGIADAVLVEVSLESRRSGGVLRINRPDRVGSTGMAEPFCILRAADLGREHRTGCAQTRARPGHELSDSEEEAVARVVLNHDRRCSAWCPYIPGLTPGEHVREASFRAYTDRLEADRARSQAASERRLTRLTIFLALVQLIVAAASVFYAREQLRLSQLPPPAVIPPASTVDPPAP